MSNKKCEVCERNSIVRMQGHSYCEVHHLDNPVERKRQEEHLEFGMRHGLLTELEYGKERGEIRDTSEGLRCNVCRSSLWIVSVTELDFRKCGTNSCDESVCEPYIYCKKCSQDQKLCMNCGNKTGVFYYI